MSKKTLIWFVGIVFSLLTAIYIGLPRALLNLANLNRLHGRKFSDQLHEALLIQPSDTWVRWRVGQYELESGNFKSAATLLEPLAPTMTGNVLALTDIMTVMRLQGEFQKVIQVLEANPTLRDVPQARALAIMSYLDVKRPKDAYDLEPTNVVALSAQINASAGDSSQTANYIEQVQHTTASALQPLNNEMALYTARAVVNLAANNVWNCEQAVNSMLTLLWKTQNVTQLRGPSDQLGDLCASKQAGRLQAELAWSHGNLKTRSTQVVPGNLVASTANNVFNAADPLETAYWQPGLFLGRQNREALYIAGADTRESPTALRIIGVWQHPLDANAPQPYAEFVSRKIRLEPNTKYRLALSYKTDVEGATAFVALLDYQANPRFVFAHTQLPNAMGKWSDWTLTNQSFTEPIEVNIVLRMLGTGSVWFDHVVLRKVTEP